MVGCVKDPDVAPYTDSEGQIFTLSIESFSDVAIGSSRAATSETMIDRGYILFYSSSTGAYKGYKAVADLNITYNGSTVYFEAGDEFSSTDKIIGIFNHDVKAEIPTDFSEVTSENLNLYFPLSATYLDAIEAEMNSGVYSLGMPMFVNDFTDSDRAVREIYRSVARMELFIKSGLTIEHDSHTHDIGVSNLSYEVVNAISVGSVGGSSAEEQSCFTNFTTLETSDNLPYALTEYTTTAEDGDNKVYLYPYAYSTKSVAGDELGATTYSNDRFSIILKHNDKNIYNGSVEEARYYKLNIVDKVSSTYFDVEANHSYRVVITAVNSRGYSSVEEAYKMPPSNIEYEIYDDKGGLTYSNGQYAISIDEVLSYDEVLVYGSKETTMEFNNIRYVLPDGGQMADEFITNEVIFEILSTTDAAADSGTWVDPADEFKVEVTSDFDFDNEGKSLLTSEGKSIKLTMTNAGECKIKLRIKLGNLEMGRDEITITKVATNGDGDGVFDAHPNHIEIAGHAFVEGTWYSDDIDFGARASSVELTDETDGGTVVYMGENTTPTGYKTMDGAVSGAYSINSYPVFSPKTRKGYYSYIGDDNETRMVMIQLEQLAPFYLGHFGSAASNDSEYHYNAIVCEKIEEIEYTDWEGDHATGGIKEWSEELKTYYMGSIWDDYMGLGNRYLNLVEGLDITTSIVENNQSSLLPTAAHYCYMKNDVNGNGKIDSDEPIKWYLPAQNQALAMWINMNVFDTDIDLYKLNNQTGDENNYYWTCSEVDDTDDYVYTPPSDFTGFALRMNMLEGQADISPKTDSWAASHIRCVRGLD